MLPIPNETTVNRIGDAASPGLRRNVLTPEGKRLQLAGKNVRGAEADEIIRRVFPPTDTAASVPFVTDPGR